MSNQTTLLLRPHGASPWSVISSQLSLNLWKTLEAFKPIVPYIFGNIKQLKQNKTLVLEKQKAKIYRQLLGNATRSSWIQQL